MIVRQPIDYTAAFYPDWNHGLIARLIKDFNIPAEDRVGTFFVGQLQKIAILGVLCG
jgi:hypothetical protein